MWKRKCVTYTEWRPKSVEGMKILGQFRGFNHAYRNYYRFNLSLMFLPSDFALVHAQRTNPHMQQLRLARQLTLRCRRINKQFTNYVLKCCYIIVTANLSTMKLWLFLSAWRELSPWNSLNGSGSLNTMESSSPAIVANTTAKAVIWIQLFVIMRITMEVI